MSEIDLKKINLNLILALDALITEQNVTRAGEKLGLGQSAMSHSLHQLRSILNDHILVRGQSSKMMLTPLAKTLGPKAKQITNEIKSLFAGSHPFLAAESKRVYHVGMSDYLAMVLLPKLMQQITNEAKNIQIVVRHLNFLNNIAIFEKEECDLVLGNFDEASELLFKQKLFTDEAVCVAHKTHPAFKKALITLDEYAKYPHVLVGLEEDPGVSFIEKIMKHKGYSIQIASIVPHTLTALYTLLPHTNFIASTVLRIAKEAKNYAELAIRPMPFQVGKYVCSQYWHPKDNDDPGHRWLRVLVKKVSEDI
ncbi:MAG TPA: LysR family transcriptional regulator [Gammaproteobacteria bacterium]|nr:LysR family transcriptional regulator [Gammaproteobacteria bacterium]